MLPTTKPNMAKTFENTRNNKKQILIYFWKFGNAENKNNETEEWAVLVPCDPEGSRRLSPQGVAHPPKVLHIASTARRTDHHLQILKNSKEIEKTTDQRNKSGSWTLELQLYLVAGKASVPLDCPENAGQWRRLRLQTSIYHFRELRNQLTQQVHVFTFTWDSEW
jgi:hypothetical protein